MITKQFFTRKRQQKICAHLGTKMRTLRGPVP